MHKNEHLRISPPSAVRDELARNLRENRLLRSLLRLSERAAEERHQERPHGPGHEADARGVAR
jgi:hypothetical protein